MNRLIRTHPHGVILGLRAINDEQPCQCQVAETKAPENLINMYAYRQI